MTPLGLAEQKVSLTYKIEDKREREKKEKEDSRARAQEISDAFKTRFDAVQQTLSSVSRVGSGFGSLFSLVGKGDAGPFRCRGLPHKGSADFQRIPQDDCGKGRERRCCPL